MNIAIEKTKKNMQRLRTTAGFTLPEFLVILALVSLLLLVFASRFQNQYIPQARDAERKTDLEYIAVAFEDYYNDNSCYPEPQVLQECGSSILKPYLHAVPCDPVTKAAYFYQPDPSNQCGGYRVLATLQSENDPDIRSIPCFSEYNYGVSQGVPVVPENCIGTPTPSPSGGIVPPSPSPGASVAPPAISPTPIPFPSGSPSPSPDYDGAFACDPYGECNVYWDPQGVGCPNSYATVWECWAACENPTNWCPQ